MSLYFLSQAPIQNRVQASAGIHNELNRQVQVPTEGGQHQALRLYSAASSAFAANRTANSLDET